MRKAVIILLLLFLAGSAAGEVYYEINADSKSARINSTVQLDCSGDNCPVTQWRLTWRKPDNAEVLGIKDSIGPVEDYTVQGDQVRITTNSGPRRKSETIKIRMRIDEDAHNVYQGLYKRTFSLPGFEGERTSGIVRIDNLLSGRVSYGFRTSFSPTTMNFTGSGPVNLRTKFGKGHQTKYFEFFGNAPEESELAYEVPVGTTGKVQDFDRFPVAVMPHGVYNSTVNQWSAGEYVGGAINIREPHWLGKDFQPVLGHEVVHGLNDRLLNWDQTSSSYFDEGTAKYVEHLLKVKIKGRGRTAELFGEPVTWTERENGRIYKYTLQPRGSKERLWNYYHNDNSYMKNWNPSDPETREFGYAYSELIIRNYISRMDGDLSQLYGKIDPGRKISSADVKWEFYGQYLDMTPCKYSSRERFESCLDTINSYNYPVYAAEPVRKDQSLKVEKLDVPNRTSTQPPILETSSRTFLQIMADLGQFLRNMIQALGASL